MRRFLITGGAGFIGSALVRYILQQGASVLVLDNLSYAGHIASLEGVDNNDRMSFRCGDIRDRAMLDAVFAEFRPTNVMHLAACTHVDRSIDSPEEFVAVNVYGTFNMLEAAKKYWMTLEGEQKKNFRFHHISTDEVFGDLGNTEGAPFKEESPYCPSSPYSASKASADHLVRAWGRTWGIPVIITNCSNNYGPRQFPEKLIPLTVLNAVAGHPLPVYGDGAQIRDWLFVEDHVRALYLVSTAGRPGVTYNIGGNCEKTNLQVITAICEILDRLKPAAGGRSYASLVTFVADRPGHDRRYAVDASRIKVELGWKPEAVFEDALRKTVQWYLDNRDGWCRRVTGDDFDITERRGTITGGGI